MVIARLAAAMVSIAHIALLLAASAQAASAPPGKRDVITLSKMDSGYRSSVDSWVRFLDCWSGRMAERLAKEGRSYSPVWKSDLANASDHRSETRAKRIAVAERRLGTALPASYRDFLLATEARFRFGLNDPGVLPGVPDSNFLAIEKIDWFHRIRPGDWKEWRRQGTLPLVADTIYYRYGHSEKTENFQDFAAFRREYLDRILYLGEFFGQSFLLLNPGEVTKDGEWEAWELSWRYAGAIRYRSFAELMQNIYYAEAEHHLVAAPTLHAPPFPRQNLKNSCANFLMTIETR